MCDLHDILLSLIYTYTTIHGKLDNLLHELYLTLADYNFCYLIRETVTEQAIRKGKLEFRHTNFLDIKQSRSIMR